MLNTVAPYPSPRSASGETTGTPVSLEYSATGANSSSYTGPMMTSECRKASAAVIVRTVSGERSVLKRFSTTEWPAFLSSSAAISAPS